MCGYYFHLDIEASLDSGAGAAPLFEIWLDGSLSDSDSLTSAGTNNLHFTMDFNNLYPSSMSFRFNGGSGDGDETITIQSVRINGQRIDNGDLTAILLSQGQQSSVDTAANDHLFGRVEPGASDLGTTTQTGDGTDESLKGDDNQDVIDGGDGNDRVEARGHDDAINGGDGNDILFGQAGNDVAIGGIGDDRIFGNEGDDLLFGQDGNDVLSGDNGNDTLNGGIGDDVLIGQGGDDILYGEDGNDRLMGVTGNNFLYGDGGDDVLAGGNQIDLMYGGADNDQMSGGRGNDEMYGEAGNDLMAGGADNDIIDGGDGNDQLFGQAGDDTLTGGIGVDILDGGAGTDTAEYGDAAGDVTASLSTGAASADGDGGSDTLSGIENLTGSAHNDTLTGNGSANVLTGADGNDTLTGRSGADTLDGGAGSDTASYADAISGVAASILTGAASDDGDGSSDTLTAIENLTGSAYSDSLAGDANANILAGNAGDDTIDGDSGNDTIEGGAGNDTIDGGGDSDTLYALDNGVSAADADNGNANTLNGGAGNDTLHGSGGTDALNGGAGDDVIHSHAAVLYTIADALAANPNVEYSADTGNFYEFVNGGVQYSTASAAASSTFLNGVAGHILTVTSQEENDFITDTLNISDHVWIAASDSGTEGTWFWTEGPESGEALSYNNWEPGEPDNTTNDNHARLRDDSGEWEDRDGEGGGQDQESYVIEWEGLDVLTADISTLNGGAGNDIMYGSDQGRDYFTYEDGTTFGYIDTIHNFNTGNGDAIDLYPLLNDYYVDAVHTLTDFVRITDNGTDSTLEVNLDGLGGGFGWQTIATIVGVTGITDEVALVASGNLIVPSVQLDIIGTPAPDVLVSDNTGHTIGGLASDDIIHGRGGNDTLYGFAGRDTASYENAAGAVTADLSAGGASNDGDGGVDTYFSMENLAGSAFGDSLTGDGFANVLTGNGGNDTLDGGAGSDTAAYASASGAITANLLTGTSSGADGADTYISIENLTGSSFNDTLTGDNNDNILSGGGGNDTIIGNGGDDALNGGEGDDILYGGAGTDALNGGAGIDTADYSSVGSAIRVDLRAGVAGNDGNGGTDTLVSIETIEGSAFNDDLGGGTGDETINGNGGDDLLYGAEGNDVLNGDAGSDTANYENAAAAVTASLAAGSAINDGDGGSDTYNAIENLIGSSHDDSLTGDNSANILAGGLGADTIDGGAGNDIIYANIALGAISADILAANPGLVYFAGTGNFYQLVTAGTTAPNAFTNAAAATITGAGGSNVNGHLVTITSQEENDFIEDEIVNDTWIAAFDSGDSDTWIWDAGPEQGTQFSNGATSVGGMYENWAGGEPNNQVGPNAQYARMVTNGQWQDNGPNNNYDYMIEWEGADVLSGGIGGGEGDPDDGGAANILRGGAGDDTIYGGDGGDTIDGGDDNDTIYGGLGSDTISGGAGDDIIYAVLPPKTLTPADIETMYGVSYSADTGNFYLFVNANDEFAEANAAAIASRIENVSGHLATITSQEENDFVENLLNDDVWLGGSDSASEDAWTWITGPESGTQFSDQGNAEPGQYENWTGGQPNDAGSGQDYMIMDENNGRWSDWPGDDNYSYVIEWEGDDVLSNDENADWDATHIINGGDGNDTIHGSAGNDTLNGDAGNDELRSGSLSTVTNTITILSNNFDSGTEGYIYADDLFEGTSEPAYADGARTTSDGATANGALQVTLAGVDNNGIEDMSGGWQHTFNMADSASNISLTFSYRALNTGGEPFENNEDLELYAELDGVLYGTGGEDFFLEEEDPNDDYDSGWTTITFNIGALGAGNHTLSLGGYISEKTQVGEEIQIRFDDITMSGEETLPGVASTLNGGDGADTLYGGAGADILNGNAGNDTIQSGSQGAYTVADALAEISGLDYNASTGSFYLYVSGAVMAPNAFSGAAAMTLNGVAGHVAHIESAPENAYLDTLTGAATIWIGAQDTAVEGEWRWIGGPNDGDLFWLGDSAGSLQAGYTYENFNTGEPNDWNSGEDYMEMTNGGLWNDNGGPEQPGLTRGYVIEWESSEVLGGGSIVTTLNGGAGADQLYGNDGTDLFVFDSNGGDAFTNPDTINDFNENGGDAVDISDILSGLGVNAGNLSQYVDISLASGVRIDTTGSGAFGAGTAIASFAGTTTISDEATLLANGQLIV